MINECVVKVYSTGYLTGETKSSFIFSKKLIFKTRWIYFVNREDWSTSKNPVMCVDHFEPKFIKQGKNLQVEMGFTSSAHYLCKICNFETFYIEDASYTEAIPEEKKMLH